MALTDSGARASKVTGGGPFLLVTAGAAWLDGDLIANNGTAFVLADDNAGLLAQWVAWHGAGSGDRVAVRRRIGDGLQIHAVANLRAQ